MLPRNISVDKEYRTYLRNTEGLERGPTVTVDSLVSDAGSTPTTRIRPGTVLVYRTADANYVAADAAGADQPTAASVSSLITNPGGGGWDGDLVITGHWGTITVGLSGDNDDAAVAAAVIAAIAAQNPEGKARVHAEDDVAASKVKLTNLDKGAGTWLHVTHATVATAFGAAGVGASGSDPKVLVTDAYVDLADENGVAKDEEVATIRKANFLESALIVSGTEGSLAAKAPQMRAVLVRLGCLE